MASTRLAIYLNDHLAAAVGAIELARRSAGANRGTSLGEMLEGLVEELEEDRATLRRVMERSGIRVDLAKATGAWVMEKLGRFKLNGSLVSYSPLSRLEELEILALGVEGKLRLWRTLRSREDLALPKLDFDDLITRAESQRRRLERSRRQAAAEAF